MRNAVLVVMLGMSMFCGACTLKAADDGDNDKKSEMKEGDENENDQEQKVAVADLPKEVSAAAATAWSGGTISDADKETENGKVVYSLEVSKDGKKYEVKVDTSGKVISNKLDDEDDDKEDND